MILPFIVCVDIEILPLRLKGLGGLHEKVMVYM